MNTKSIDELIKDYFRLLLASKGEKRAKQKKRFDTILLYMEGYPRKQIAEILHIPHRTVNYYIARYKKEGFDALFLMKQPGAPKNFLMNRRKNLFLLSVTGLRKKQVLVFLPTGLHRSHVLS